MEEIKAGGGIAIVAGTPQNTKKFAPITKDAGTDYFVVASTVTTARHVSSSLKGLQLDELVDRYRVDELMLTTMVYGHADRRRSYELVAHAWNLSAPIVVT